MIVHNGKRWRTLADKLYHGGRQIAAVYKGGVQYYPDGPGPGPEPGPYLAFYSTDGEFTIGIGDRASWNGILEYSVDTVTWSEYEKQPSARVPVSSNAGLLYFRGSGNTHLQTYYSAYMPNFFEIQGSGIHCIGNIETLLDYASVQRGEHPRMDAWCFQGLFMDCRTLVSAPELPATELSGGCYKGMFYDCWALEEAPSLPAKEAPNYCYEIMFRFCTSLVLPPELPATVVGEEAYDQMFSGCTKLQRLPKLPAKNLPWWCYFYMFADCTSIKMSETMEDEYQYAYRIPSSGAGTGGQGTNGMFARTGGTFKGTPAINTTYYTDHEPV